MSMRECLEYYILHFYTLTVGGTYHEALVCRVLDIREVTMYFFSPLLPMGAATAHCSSRDLTWLPASALSKTWQNLSLLP